MNKLLNLEPVKSSHNIIALRKLYDCVEIQIRNLSSLNVTSGSYGHLLTPILLKLIPNDLALEFTRKTYDKRNFDIELLLTYLRTEIECRESAVQLSDSTRHCPSRATPENFRKQNENFRKNNFSRYAPSATALNTSVKYSCVFCENQDHESEKCPFSIPDRKAKLMNQGKCFKCFKINHLAFRCWRKIFCNICKNDHNTLLCEKQESKILEKRQKINSEQVSSETASTSVSTCNARHLGSNSKVLLQTCTARIINKTKSRVIRCLFDGGAQKSFITQKLADVMNLPIVGVENLQIYAFGSNISEPGEYKRVKVNLCHAADRRRQASISALVVDEITQVETFGIPSGWVRKIMREKGLELSDSSNNSEIDILIGCDFYWELMTGRTHRLSRRLVAIESLFGTTIQGQMPINAYQNSSVSVNKICVEEKELISKEVRAIWELDLLGIKENENENIEVENNVIKEFERNIAFKNNRYETKLIWKMEHENIENNYEMAKNRLIGLSKRFKQNSWLFKEYENIFKEQLKENIIEECEFNPQKDNCFYMPHHPVIREEKSTKVRIVFDASAKGKNNISLNDCLLSGPNLNPDLLMLLLRFRSHNVAFSADIEKAFLQISLAEEDRNFLRFLWISKIENDKSNNFKIFRMARIPFGVCCSPFLLTATIRHHLKNYERDKKNTCDMLRNLYVDDLIYGSDTASEAFSLTSEAVKILRDANMNLRKWVTNSKELEQKWEQNKIRVQELTDDEGSIVKILGIKWNYKHDTFQLDITSLIEGLKKKENTKRFVLKTLAKVFDPIGFLSPFMIRIKCLLQEIWERGLDWDQELPNDLKLKFECWCSEITQIDSFSLSRQYFNNFIKTDNENIQLHIFCDASPTAYGAVAYFRYEREDGIIETNFIMSKSRVSPLKKLTLPRLELMGAVIGARISRYLKMTFNFILENVFLWSDSTIVLHWIKGNARQWKPFVSNRIIEIQTLTEPDKWFHCRSKENPADVLTRGEKIKDLITNKTWWQGPNILFGSEEKWRIRSTEQLTTDIKEEKKTKFENSVQLACSISITQEAAFDLNKYSNLTQVIRITAWLRRFLHNGKFKDNRKTGPLTAKELSDAKVYWIKYVQAINFNSELQHLSQGKRIEKSSPLSDFNPILDDNGIICVGGRLQNSKLQFHEKHPWIIPKKSKFTELLILQCHEKVFHGGVTETLTQLREKFWILKGRQAVKTVLNTCLICRKYKVQPGTQIVAPLPLDRIQSALPFEVTGLDFAGPLYVKESETIKCYILLCTCAVTRAIHLELVTDLTTETFLLALRRFFSRRGISSTIYSDNAKTFKRANIELKELWSAINNDKTANFYSKNGIKWKFIIERGAWWGGFWERMVKSIKTCIRKLIGKSSLTMNELHTMLTETEAVINSRPITFLCNEPGEPSPLTPAHFLIGKRITSLPPFSSNPKYTSIQRKTLIKKYLYRQRLLETFWKRWKNEYLLLLRSAHSSRLPAKETSEFKINDVVLIHDEKLPRNMWKLGRVAEVYRGRDGRIRACELKTSGTNIKRPIQLLYNLELND